ncbi:25S rRNA (uracil2843-N3)-methyltransferase PWA37_000054 [Arxiozyma heterogenica]|uniref:25S rRNA (uracil2843-N3)-methyltransferase n=1 Tax=Arxiozyma heterogenica TaxID=278026 RepID=UPI002EE32EDB
MSEKQLPSHNKITLPPQEIIDLFKVTFSNELYVTDFNQLLEQIQKVKTELYNREYIEAFNEDWKRVAYCCRWTPSRAISYASLLSHFPEIVDIITKSNESNNNNNNNGSKILCVGGGAGAELIAITSIFTPFIHTKKKKNIDNDSKNTLLEVTLIDIANWDHVIKRIMDQVKEKWLYNNIWKTYKVNFLNHDILRSIDDEDVKNATSLKKLNLITMLFTTNELFKEDRARSIRFLQRLNQQCQQGCYLLILESAGSYSHITVGSKKFPIQFLIDTILIGARGKGIEGCWELISQNDSIWYRCDNTLDYPIRLENMRFFYRLYRKK